MEDNKDLIIEEKESAEEAIEIVKEEAKAKPRSKSRSKAKPKAEPEAEPIIAEFIAEPKAETKTETKAETRTTTKPEPKVEFVAEPKAEPAEKISWGKKGVTRRFLIIALAIALALNAALSAGIMALFAKNSKAVRPDMPNMGRPGSGWSQDNRQNGNWFGDFDDDDDDDQNRNWNGSQNGNQNGSQSQSSKASIGIVIRDDSGVYVAQVTGNNAKQAGFSEGDKVVSIDGKNISSSSDLISEVQSHKSGDTVSIVVERNGQSVEIKTVLE